MLNSNETIKVAHPQQLVNQSMLNSALVIKKSAPRLVKSRKYLVFDQR